MSMPLLPMWLRIGWTVALGAVVLVHLWHAGSRPGQARWWHAGHTSMALSMAGMYLWGRGIHPDLYRVGGWVFAAWAVALVVTAEAARRREGVLNRLWVAAAVDMAAMAYMLLPAHLAVVSLVLVVYLFGQSVAWAAGLWGRAVGPGPVAAVGGGTAAGRPAGNGVGGRLRLIRDSPAGHTADAKVARR
ncbi:DUF5134 domain-containing protein [Actinomadura sp. BRA 177]|nr:DUF5134 domain-containing protein [Actinomadura sp. BRA 177]NVI86238.1 DUF5134 domain-containing protein [Actinomadura sp. BRA 177]